MTRTMQSLEGKKYVTRKNNTEDSRSYIFELTEKAIHLRPDLLDILSEWNDILLQGIDKELADLIKSQLDKMVDNVIKDLSLPPK